MRRTALLGSLVGALVLVLAAGCSQSIKSLNSSAKEAASYDGAASLYQAIDAGGVETLAFNDKGEGPGPGGVPISSSGDVLLDTGSVGLVVVSPALADDLAHAAYATDYLATAEGIGVEDPTALVGPNWVATGTLDHLIRIQEAVGGQLRQ